MRTPKRFNISKCLLRRRAMLDARFRTYIFAKDCPRCSAVCLRYLTYLLIYTLPISSLLCSCFVLSQRILYCQAGKARCRPDTKSTLTDYWLL